MTKEEYKRKFVDTGKLTWDKTNEDYFEFMYDDFKFIDSTVAWIFDVPMELVIKKRKAFGISIKRDDDKTLVGYKQQGYMNWDKIDHDRFDYLYNICNLSGSLLAELFDIPKSTVTKKIIWHLHAHPWYVSK